MYIVDLGNKILGTADLRITPALLATMSLCACSSPDTAPAQRPSTVASACELATDGATLDGRLVRFRSRFDVAVEHVRVYDSGCPELMVFLHKAADSNVDLTLCSEPNFRFGCPVSPDFGVKATFTGVFHASKKGGTVDIISMKDVSGEGGRKESSNLERLREALPGARIEPVDPSQLEKLGPSAVPGILPDAVVNLARRKALEGDGATAYQLVHHYNLVGNQAESGYWARIGAENGEYNSMVLMGYSSGREGGLDGCVRAVYWFRRARAELKADLKLQKSAESRGDFEVLIRSADAEIADLRNKTAGC